MLKVKFDRNYNYPDIFRQSPGNKGIWNNLELISEGDCDIYIVFNTTEKCDYKISCKEGGRILCMQEPPYDQKRHFLNYQNDFDCIISHFDKTEVRNIRQPGMLPWFVEKTYDELKALQLSELEKQNKVVWITSNRRGNPGHDARLTFLDLLQENKNPQIEIYGKGINPIDDKFEALSKVKYTLAVENYSDSDYWTEKIMDAYLSLTIPIYYGCTNLDDYFPKESFIQIDINKPEYSYDKICDILASNYFEENKNHIIEAKNRVLDKYQFFPWLESLLENGDIKLGNQKTFDFYRTPKASFFHRLKNRLQKK